MEQEEIRCEFCLLVPRRTKPLKQSRRDPEIKLCTRCWYIEDLHLPPEIRKKHESQEKQQQELEETSRLKIKLEKETEKRRRRKPLQKTNVRTQEVEKVSKKEEKKKPVKNDDKKKQTRKAVNNNKNKKTKKPVKNDKKTKSFEKKVIKKRTVKKSTKKSLSKKKRKFMKKKKKKVTKKRKKRKVSKKIKREKRARPNKKEKTKVGQKETKLKIKRDTRQKKKWKRTTKVGHTKKPNQKISRYKGVAWCNQNKRWIGQIYYERKQHYVGYSTNQAELAQKIYKHIQNLVKKGTKVNKGYGQLKKKYHPVLSKKKKQNLEPKTDQTIDAEKTKNELDKLVVAPVIIENSLDSSESENEEQGFKVATAWNELCFDIKLP